MPACGGHPVVGGPRQHCAVGAPQCDLFVTGITRVVQRRAADRPGRLDGEAGTQLVALVPGVGRHVAVTRSLEGGNPPRRTQHRHEDRGEDHLGKTQPPLGARRPGTAAQPAEPGLRVDVRVIRWRQGSWPRAAR